MAYCLIFLHSLLTSTRFGLLLLADLKFHFTTSRFEAHSINTYIEQSAGDSYFSSHHTTPLSSFFTMRQTNQYGRNIFGLPYSDLSKVEFKSTHFATETLTEMLVVKPNIKPHKPVCNFWKIQFGAIESTVVLHLVFRLTTVRSELYYTDYVKGKAGPLQAWSGLEGSRKLRFPDIITTAQDGGKVVSLTHWSPLRPGNTPGTHFC